MPFHNLIEAFGKLTKRYNNKKSKTILFAPIGSVGHINSLIAIANHLKACNHRTVFLFTDPFENNLSELGHEVYDCSTEDLTPSVIPEGAPNKWVPLVQQFRDVWSQGEAVITNENMRQYGFKSMIEDVQRYNPVMEKKVALIKPDLLIIDHFFGLPALFKLNLPWVLVNSASPLTLHNNPELPRGWLGLPTKYDKNDPRQRDWCERALKADMNTYNQYNEYWKSHGLPDLPLDPVSCIPKSPYLNIYMYPEELDYSDYPLEGWDRCDCMVRDQKAKAFEVPEKLRDKPGKLIFLSLGSLASIETSLMKRLTSLLADCPHRFIVCKGVCHDQYELPDNMWGDKYVPQLEVLKSIDLIITHGGNNTLTESFYYGVPGFIVCPLFGDQFDNAQRLEENGLGIRLDPYNCTKEQLHGAIEDMLTRHDLKDRMRAISERMQKPEARNKAAKLVKDLVDRI